MDWLTLMAVLACCALCGRILIRIGRLESRVSTSLRQIDEKDRVRQGKIAGDRASYSTPKVDATARTVRRDTKDLPKTGRQSSGLKFVMKGGDIARDTEDTRLLPDSGTGE